VGPLSPNAAHIAIAKPANDEGVQGRSHPRVLFYATSSVYSR
jgi:hypothetical protein